MLTWAVIERERNFERASGWIGRLPLSSFETMIGGVLYSTFLFNPNG
jgi:hypothetical protein